MPGIGLIEHHDRGISVCTGVAMIFYQEGEPDDGTEFDIWLRPVYSGMPLEHLEILVYIEGWQNTCIYLENVEEAISWIKQDERYSKIKYIQAKTGQIAKLEEI